MLTFCRVTDYACNIGPSDNGRWIPSPDVSPFPPTPIFLLPPPHLSSFFSPLFAAEAQNEDHGWT